MANASEYAQMNLEAQRNNSGSDQYNDLAGIANSNMVGTDWQDEILGPGSSKIITSLLQVAPRETNLTSLHISAIKESWKY